MPQKPTVQTECCQCGAVIFRQPYRMSIYPKHFCSLECRAKYQVAHARSDEASVRQRLANHCSIDPVTECWNWTACKGYGYGLINIGSRMFRVHRLMYELDKGPIPPGLTLDHLCRNRACFNPAHLEPVTNAENVLRGNGPSARGARQTHCTHGHLLAGDNISTPRHTHPNERRCKVCARQQQIARRAQRKAEQCTAQ